MQSRGLPFRVTTRAFGPNGPKLIMTLSLVGSCNHRLYIILCTVFHLDFLSLGDRVRDRGENESSPLAKFFLSSTLLYLSCIFRWRQLFSCQHVLWFLWYMIAYWISSFICMLVCGWTALIRLFVPRTFGINQIKRINLWQMGWNKTEHAKSGTEKRLLQNVSSRMGRRKANVLQLSFSTHDITSTVVVATANWDVEIAQHSGQLVRQHGAKTRFFWEGNERGHFPGGKLNSRANFPPPPKPPRWNPVLCSRRESS